MKVVERDWYAPSCSLVSLKLESLVITALKISLGELPVGQEGQSPCKIIKFQ